MRVLVTGASGYIASSLIPQLLGAGHAVVGLARSDAAAAAVRALGAEVRRGDLDDVDGLSAAAGECDGVVHLAFKHDEQQAGNLPGAVAADLAAIGALTGPLRGTGKPFVGTTATGAFGLGGWTGELTEQSVLPGGLRIDAENAVVALGEQGVRSSVVRLPPSVHGLGQFGFVSSLIELARATGVSGYVADGSNRWPAADVRDVAALYRLALESATPGARLHAVGEDGVALRDIAQGIARRLAVPAEPVDGDRLAEHFGHVAPFVGLDNPTSSRLTRDALGWAPTRPGLLADLASDHRLVPAAAR